MDTKLIIGLGVLTIGGIYLFKKKKETQANVRHANAATSDLNDPATGAALSLKKALGVEKWPVAGWSGKRIRTEGGKADLFNACLEVTNWAETQKVFSQTCDNEITLIGCLQEYCDTETYNTALQLIKADKVISTQPCNAMLTLYDENNKAINEGINTEFPANAILGALVASYNGNVSFINGFQTDNDYWFVDLYKTTGYTSANKVKIVNPN